MSILVTTKKYDNDGNCTETKHHLVQIDKLDLLKSDQIVREKTALNPTPPPEITKQAFIYQKDPYPEAELLFSIRSDNPRFFFTGIKYCMSQQFPPIASNGHPSSRYIKVSDPTLLESFRSIEKILNVSIVKNAQSWASEDTQEYVTMKVTADTVFHTKEEPRKYSSYNMENLPSKYNIGNVIRLYFKLYNVSSEERNISKDFIEIDTIWVKNDSVGLNELYFNTNAEED